MDYMKEAKGYVANPRSLEMLEQQMKETRKVVEDYGLVHANFSLSQAEAEVSPRDRSELLQIALDDLNEGAEAILGLNEAFRKEMEYARPSVRR